MQTVEVFLRGSDKWVNDMCEYFEVKHDMHIFDVFYERKWILFGPRTKVVHLLKHNEEDT